MVPLTGFRAVRSGFEWSIIGAFGLAGAFSEVNTPVGAAEEVCVSGDPLDSLSALEKGIIRIAPLVVPQKKPTIHYPRVEHILGFQWPPFSKFPLCQGLWSKPAAGIFDLSARRSFAFRFLEYCDSRGSLFVMPASVSRSRWTLDNCCLFPCKHR